MGVEREASCKCIGRIETMGPYEPIKTDQGNQTQELIEPTRQKKGCYLSQGFIAVTRHHEHTTLLKENI